MLVLYGEFCVHTDLLDFAVPTELTPPSSSPSGIRIGTPAVTSRGFSLADMDRVAGFIHSTVQIAQKVAGGLKTTKIQEFEACG